MGSVLKYWFSVIDKFLLLVTDDRPSWRGTKVFFILKASRAPSIGGREVGALRFPAIGLTHPKTPEQLTIPPPPFSGGEKLFHLSELSCLVN